MYLKQKLISIAAVCLLCSSASASTIEYDLSGVSAAPILNTQVTNNPMFRLEQSGAYTFYVDWTGATLVHDTRGTDSFADDVISITGTVSGCTGATGGNCFNDDSYETVITHDPAKRFFRRYATLGAGDFEIDAAFNLDGNQTTSNDDLIARAQAAGDFTLRDPNSPHNNLVQQLMLKDHPDLGWAFRLYDDGTLGENQFRIETWLLNQGGILGDQVRHETRPGEAVFNGGLIATRRGGGEAEVPEPFTAGLLGIGLAVGAARRRKQKS